jgi:hypothetical protein
LKTPQEKEGTASGADTEHPAGDGFEMGDERVSTTSEQFLLTIVVGGEIWQ